MSRKPCHMCEPTRCRCDERFAPVPEIRSVPEAPAQGDARKDRMQKVRDFIQADADLARGIASTEAPAQPSVPAPWREAVNPPGERGIYLVRIGDQTHVAQFDPRMVSAKWWKAYGLPSRLAQEPTHWMPLPEPPAAIAQLDRLGGGE